MARPPFNPNKVDWSGENPGMYLKESADGPFVTLISFFRVVTSTHGKGHAAFMLLDPHGDGRNPEKPNVCLTDNEPLADYVKMYELIGSAVHPTRVVGISMNTYDLSDDEARQVCEAATRETGLPCTDPVRFGAEPLLEAIHAAYRAKQASRKA